MSENIAPAEAVETIVTEVAETGAISTEPPASEPVAEVEAKPEPKKDFLAPKFAALSRKERELRAQERQLKQREEEFQRKSTSTEQDIKSKYMDPEEFKRNPWKVITDAGFTFEQLAEMALNQGKPTPEMLLKESERTTQERLDAWEKKLAEKDAAEKAQREAQVIENYKNQIAQFVNSNNEYELIRVNEASELVFEVINAHHEQTGQILEFKVACDAVEEQLLEEAKKYLPLSKIKGLLTPQSQVEATPKKQPVTLSNTSAAQVPKSGARSLSDEESKSAAAKLIRWND